MISKLKSTLALNLSNMRGWRTNRKIVVFESDDWGSIRMASKRSYNTLLRKGYPVNQCDYNRNDALESNEDLTRLMEVLDMVKDKNGNPAKITMNNIVANPIFDKIKQSGFSKYYFEPFTETLKRYENTDRVMGLYLEGLERNLFQMQFHGREHVNINRWLYKLKSGDQALLDAFEQNMFTLSRDGNTSGRRDNLDAFGMAYSEEFESMESIIESGLELFKDIWGFGSKSFIAPCYVWPKFIEQLLYNHKVQYIQGGRAQIIPLEGLELRFKKKYHYTGESNEWSMKYLVRNVQFEPVAFSSNKNTAVDLTMKDIHNAFLWNKPAIISTHRVNYIGRINPVNSDENLKLLEKLIKKIVKRYPNVEFMSTDQVGELIKN